MRAAGVYARTVYKFIDVPQDIRERPVDLPVFDLRAIMDSFTVVYRPPTIKTSGGDPVKLGVEIQAADLTKPQTMFWLEDRCIKFYGRVIEGNTLYLPTSIFRARGEWRVRIVHTNGVFTDSVRDSEHGLSILSSLHEAWIYAVSLYRDYPAPVERLKQVKQPLLYTGVPHVTLQPAARTDTYGTVYWTFSVKVGQRMGDGRTRHYTVKYWRLESVTTRSMTDALRKATAILAYRAHRLASGLSPDAAFIGQHEIIPSEFWPNEPVCTVTADDLYYYVENKW